jgi:hypothetical protein
VSQLTVNYPLCQTFRTHTYPIPSENLKEAADFFSAPNSAPLRHTSLSPFDFSSLKNAFPVTHQNPQVHMPFPDMLQGTIRSHSPGAAWASDFMSFQQTRPSSPSKQAMATPPSVMTQNVQQQALQNPGL